MLILIDKNSDLLALSVLGADKNVVLFPIDVELALDLLIDLGGEVETVHALGFDSVGLDIFVIHLVVVSAGILSTSNLLIHVTCLYK